MHPLQFPYLNNFEKIRITSRKSKEFLIKFRNDFSTDLQKKGGGIQNKAGQKHRLKYQQVYKSFKFNKGKQSSLNQSNIIEVLCRSNQRFLRENLITVLNAANLKLGEALDECGS
ncbi:unnamed protein product [Paramecium octaurelia]|uniref:Uncharacterized protein n=1 Tax=Paramecium octaurelia TaxID=43137 RepID=A0A8S1YL30_PAROT|nr:unnamed protein product [Paramecium octaurelia]